MDQSPQWQPIDRLAMVAAALTGELVEAERMRRLLEEARPRPHVLDDATVARERHSYTGIQDDLWLYAEQLQRWERGALTADQRQALEQLAGQLGRLRAAVAGILALIDELAEGTIERMLGMSDVEAGLAWLRRQGQRKAACRAPLPEEPLCPLLHVSWLYPNKGILNRSTVPRGGVDY